MRLMALSRSPSEILRGSRLERMWIGGGAEVSTHAAIKAPIMPCFMWTGVAQEAEGWGQGRLAR